MSQQFHSQSLLWRLICNIQDNVYNDINCRFISYKKILKKLCVPQYGNDYEILLNHLTCISKEYHLVEKTNFKV